MAAAKKKAAPKKKKAPEDGSADLPPSVPASGYVPLPKAAAAATETTAAAAEYVRREVPKIYSRELVDVIFEQPYCRIANLATAGIAKRQTASKYLKALADIGVLEERAAGREKLFIHPRLMRLLTSDDNTVQPYR